jgi:formate dehydrogenase subunit gamma
MGDSRSEGRERYGKAVELLQVELEEELRRALGVPVSARDSGRIRELLEQGFTEHIRSKFDQLKEDIREQVKKEKREEVREAVLSGEAFYRFGVNIRVQHFVLAVSMVLLILSGLPVRFHDSVVFKFVIFLLGGIHNSTFLHRVGAAGLMIVCLWHMGWLAFTKSGRREFIALLPMPKDVLDVIQNMKYFLRVTDQKARFDRFSYIEKFDYWAVYWGVVVMVGSGLMLWFQDVTLRYLPKFLLDVAKEMHRDEALLATLAIVIWHMYNAHLNPHKFPGTLVIWNGLMTKEEMLDEHPVEYERHLRREGESGNS